MRADQLLRGGALALVVGLALFGCDDQPTEDVGDSGMQADSSMGAGGAAGAGGVAGAGGEAGTGGAAGEGGMACVCDRGVCDDAGDCVDADPCADDTECLDGNICDAGACTPGCETDAACAMANPDRPICIEGRCGNCREDADCFGAGTCDPEAFTCVEPDPCADSRECTGDRLCIDGACADAPDCNAEGSTCPAGWTCLADGECAPSRTGECADDDACGLGQFCLTDQRPPVCGACQNDAHCPGSQICALDGQGNRCVESGACGADDDCALGRVCDGGSCAPPACEDDAAEPNQELGEAAELSPGLTTGLVSCDPDWYIFDLPADTAAEVVLRQQDRNADLTLVLLAGEDTEVARSETAEPNEAAVAGPYPTDRPILVRVEQAGPLSVGAYTLEVSLFIEGERCVDDQYDVGAGDDDRATGRLVRAPGEGGFTGDLSGRICPGDVDYLCFQVNAREEVSVTVEVLAGNPVVVGELFDAEDAPVDGGTGRWSRDGEPMDITARPGVGIACLRLSTENGSAGTYRASISAISPEVRALCADAEPLALAGGAVSVNDTLGPVSVSSPSCAAGPADGGEKVYTITVDDPNVAGCAQNPCLYPPALLTARVTGVPEGTLGDPVVSVRADCADAESEAACADDSVDPRDPLFPLVNPAVIRVPVNAPGDYTIIVDGIDVGPQPDFRLQLDALPLAARPPNDTCGNAPLLDLLGGVAEVNANLGQATDDYAACLGAGAPDVAYRIQLDRPAYVRVQALAQPTDFAVGAYLVANCADPAPLGCGFGFEGPVPPGEYFVVIDGADPNARGRVTAQIIVEPFGDPPANDTCEGAERLDAAGGDLSGDTLAANDDYRLVDGNPCTDHNTLGGDVAYLLPRQAEGRYFIEATPIGGWDLSLYVVSSCDDPAANRRACSDGALTESVVFDVPGGDLFVVVDGSNGEGGRFDLRWGPADCAGDFDCDGGQVCVDYQCVDSE